ncbi:MAG: hypothetical protein ACYSUP_00220 [Planctomycetota bacterium]|jgi:hypothetical protein
MLTRKTTFRTILVLAFFSVHAADGDWFKVNDGNALDWGAGVSQANIGKNAQGDLFCLFRSKDFDTGAMLRFSSGGENPPKKWEFFTEGTWTNQSADLPAAAFNTIAMFKGSIPLNGRELRLFPLPGDDEGLLGMLVFNVHNSTIGLDVHGAPGNVLFNDPNDGNGPRWRQWNSGTDYEPYYMRALIPSWTGCNAGGGYDFALDPDAGTGLVVGTKGFTYAWNCENKLTAARYVHNHATQRWHRWDATTGSWTTNFTWPHDAQVDKYTILDPSAEDCEKVSYPKLEHLGGGNYLVLFNYDPNVDASGGEITSAARYDGDTATWSWWDGSDWAQGGDYDYGTVVDSPVCASAQLVAVDQNVVSMFYVSSGTLYELTYDESGAQPNFGSPVEIGAAYTYRAAVEPNGSVWLYYANSSPYPSNDDPNVYLKKKPLDGSWSNAQAIYQTVPWIYVVEATFVGDSNIPVCFIKDAGQTVRLYAISSPDANNYWAGETPVTLTPPPAPGQADSRIVWVNEVEGDDECSGYGGNPTVHLALDDDGYLYAPDTGFCELRVRHKDDTDPANNRAWGEFWDLIAFPGGAAVDNVGEKVYVANRLIPSDNTQITGGGHIRAFDRSKRTKRLGWGSLPECYDETYSPQEIGEANWPGDVAVDETQGLLYVTSSSDCEIKIYDIESTPPTPPDSFGSEGDANGQFKFPQGIDVDPNGNIYVADTGNHRIQKFDPNGDFLTSWGSFGNGNGQFYYPFSVTADPKYNLVYITDPFNRRVQIFDRQGNFIYAWGKWDPDEGAAEEFIETGGVAADGKGNLCVNTNKGGQYGEYIVKFSIYMPDIDYNRNGIPDSLDGFCASPTVYNVTRDKFYSSINSAINDANSGDELAVYPGTYYESVDFDGLAITLRSLDPNDAEVVAVTIIDGNGSGNVVTFDTSETSSSVLEGLTITDGNRGIYCYYASPTISKCVITGNTTAGTDDGAGMYNNHSSPTVLNCTFSNNEADWGGGMNNYYGQPVVCNCIFKNNTANDGAGMYNEDCTAIVDDCVFAENTAYDDGGGIYNRDIYSASKITSCVFWANSADDGGGIKNDSSDHHILNCTFFDNDADDDGGAIYNYSSDPDIANCIFWQNTAGDSGDDIYNSGSSNPNAHDNFYDDPDFADENDQDGDDDVWGTCDDGLNLQSTSDCIDEGDNDDAEDDYDDLDIKGSDRIINGDVDIGAYELHWPSCWSCPTQCHGDADCSGTVNSTDQAAMMAAFFESYGDPNYNPCADFSKDGDINFADLGILRVYYDTSPDPNCDCGGTWPPQ